MIHDLTLTTSLIFVAHWAIVIALSLRVIMRRLPVGVSLAWLAVIFSIPFAGAVIYLLIGENRLSRKYVERAAAIHQIYSEWQQDLQRRASEPRPVIDPKAASLQYHAQTLVGFPPMQGNRLRLMADFKTVFESIIADLDRARRTCHLEFYIWHMGGMADQVAEALIRAVNRGVCAPWDAGKKISWQMAYFVRIILHAKTSPFRRSRCVASHHDSGDRASKDIFGYMGS